MQDPTDQMIPVVAHGLLNSMSVIMGALTVLDAWPALDPADREDLLERAITQAAFVSASLKDFAQGLPPGATAVLEELDHVSAPPRLVALDRPAPERTRIYAA